MRMAATLGLSEQRGTLRHEAQLNAGIRPLGSATSRIHVTDISTVGCGIELRHTIAPGTQVWVRLPGLESWFGQVAWAAGGKAGVAFEKPLHSAVLARLVGQHP